MKSLGHCKVDYKEPNLVWPKPDLLTCVGLQVLGSSMARGCTAHQLLLQRFSLPAMGCYRGYQPFKAVSTPRPHSAGLPRCRGSSRQGAAPRSSSHLAAATSLASVSVETLQEVAERAAQAGAAVWAQTQCPPVEAQLCFNPSPCHLGKAVDCQGVPLC